MLLYFKARNFRSFYDEMELSLLSPSMKTNIPRQGEDWIMHTRRVAAIFGPNASGKTTVLEAVRALSVALRSPGSGLVNQPSKGSIDADIPVEFETGFIADGIRYEYYVTVAAWGIAYEALYSYPKGTRRMLFERMQETPSDGVSLKAGNSLTGPNQEVLKLTKPKMLFLALAHRYGHKFLSKVASALIDGVGIDHISFRDRQDEEVLRRVIMEMVASPDDTQTDLVHALIQAADLGIENIEVRREEISEQDRTRIVRILQALEEGEEVHEDSIPRLRDVIVFHHKAQDGGTFKLPVQRQSSGTITWLTTAWHALDALRQGSVLLIDELDASLHPDLVRFIVQLFKTPHLNQRGAQLIFSTHDVSLLGNSPTKLLEPKEIWFTDKDEFGHSELVSLDEYDNRAGNNTERRYLAGQFGATPDIDDTLVMDYLFELEAI